MATIQANLLSGKIASTTAPAGVGIGYDDNAQTGVGQASAVVLELALYGDANLDGVVDSQDLTLLATDWKKSTNLWTAGDFNHDGVVDSQDLTLLATNWKKTYTSPSLPFGGFSGDSLGGPGSGGPMTVPKPGTLVLLLLAVLGVGTRLWVRKQRG